jgi:hypothetical protein
MNAFQTSMSVLLGLSLGGAPVVAFSKECTQENAIYDDASQNIRLRFLSPSEAATVSHLFTVEIAKADVTIDGNVQMTDVVPRSLGTLLYQCPEGDVTGADLEACTVWQGLVYAIDSAGTVGNLADGKAQAAKQLLLADFGAALRQSKLWTDSLAPAPYDVFLYSGCRS